MKALFLNLVLAAASSASWAADVPRNLSFKVDSHPEVWSTGSTLCYTVDNKKSCTTVQEFGEIQLRLKKVTPATFKNYFDKLSTEDQIFLNDHVEFVVRYLSLDGNRQGGYIVQILQSVLGGSQAIYAYGNYQWPQGEVIQLEPVGYGEAGALNLSALRKDDQRTIRIAHDVIRAWSVLPSSAPVLPPRR